MTGSLVTVFGGTGFLGREIVRCLAKQLRTVRVAVRHPLNPTDEWPGDLVTQVAADVRDPLAVRRAIAGSSAVIDAVACYVEHGENTFRSIHVDGARNVASAANREGVERCVLISGIGASANSRSAYVRSRGEGEVAFLKAFPKATVVRPSALFGPADALLRSLDKIVRASPVVPLFGSGRSRIQPVYVGDVATAVSALASSPATSSEIFELGGPQIFRYRELFKRIQSHRGLRRCYVRVPLPVWMMLAKVLSVLPNPPLTVDQLALVQDDNIVGTAVSTFADLGLTPRSVEDLLPECLP